MPKQTKATKLTKHGQKLYWLLREHVTNSNGFHLEFTVEEFIDLLCDYGAVGNCLNCGWHRNLLGSAFCVGCSRNAVQP